MLQLAKENIASATGNVDPPPEIEYTNSDIFQHLDAIDNGQFDLILCLGLIAHTGRLDVLFSKLKHILASEGAILLQSTLLNRFFTRTTRLATSERYARNHGYSITYYTENEIRDIAGESGLTICEQTNFFLGIPFGDRVFPSLNYFLESKLQPWSRRHGT